MELYRMISQYSYILYLLLFWAFVYSVDQILRTKTNQSIRATYVYFLRSCGISLHPMRIQWYTTSFNRFFKRLGDMKPRLLDRWFDLGVYITLLCTVISVCFLMIVPFNTLLRSQKPEDQILKPVIPGVNLPKTDIGYYLVTLFLSAVLHEIGHAVAAVREGVSLNGFGMFMLLIYPGAFVDMNSESLFGTSPWKQLKIFCAGVWHNVIISLVGLIALVSLPVLLQPFYTVHEHLTVVSHTDNSIVSGPSGLVIGDVITYLDGDKVTTISDWMQHLSIILQSEKPIAYKIPPSKIDLYKIPKHLSDSDCICERDDKEICFQKVGTQLSKPIIRCLQAREAISYGRCPPDHHHECMVPYTKHMDNFTKLIVIDRVRGPPVLFYGHPADLHQSLILGEVVPKSSYIPLFLPYMLENMFKYFISLSGALAILNVVPCYALDGQYIAKAFIDIILAHKDKESRETIFTCVVLAGTLLLFINILLAMYLLVFG